MLRSILAYCLAAACVTGAVIAVAAQSSQPSSAGAPPLLAHDLDGVPGKEIIMQTLEFPPGHVSPAHRHDATVLVYVLEGTFVTQVDGQPERTLRAGETFLETPQDIHRLARNPSTTQRTKILTVIVKNKGAPVSTLVTDSAPR